MTEERRILELAIIGLETERKRIEQELSDRMCPHSSHKQRQYIKRVVWVIGVEYDYVGCSRRQDDVVAMRHAVLIAVGHFDDKWQITFYRCLNLTSRHDKPVISNTCRVNSLVGGLSANQLKRTADYAVAPASA